MKKQGSKFELFKTLLLPKLKKFMLSLFCGWLIDCFIERVLMNWQNPFYGDIFPAYGWYDADNLVFTGPMFVFTAVLTVWGWWLDGGIFGRV